MSKIGKGMHILQILSTFTDWGPESFVTGCNFLIFFKSFHPYATVELESEPFVVSLKGFVTDRIGGFESPQGRKHLAESTQENSK